MLTRLDDDGAQGFQTTVPGSRFSWSPATNKSTLVREYYTNRHLSSLQYCPIGLRIQLTFLSEFKPVWSDFTPNIRTLQQKTK